MKQRQKKVQEFLDAPEGRRRVVTTGGIYGSITKIERPVVQLQIADKVRVEVARAAIGGYQGQAPGRRQRRTHNIMTKNLRWKVSSSSSRVVALGGPCRRSIPPERARFELGLDLKGGVHLVLRVQTDDALRLETETTAERLREAAEDGGHHRHRRSRVDRRHVVPRRRRARRRRTRRSAAR